MAFCTNYNRPYFRGVGDAQWYEAPTGRKGIAQGKAKRRPGIRDETICASPERAKPNSA